MFNTKFACKFIFCFCYRKFALVAKLQPANRFQEIGSRISEVFKLGFFQTRMVKLDFKPGLMHAAFFFGFSMLLIRKIQLLIIGFDAHYTYPEWFGGPYSALKDFVELCVTAGVLYVRKDRGTYEMDI